MAEFKDPVTGQCQVNSKLVDALEQLRALVDKPITITSGYRSPQHNAAVGGVEHSQHELGMAADIKIAGLDTFQLYVLADQIPLFSQGGIGIYPGQDFIHVDVRSGRARWARVNGD